ncbi:hypothetical protein GOP47_0019872 [Adiantum capillus-veneris]|uniref:RRM domain-containing protein n=1 Tax=Adiantum capillus-veneris TaxID=13818 RepID=A0A9D4UCC1_ADICA|nr:hypothetical protein GOP47_0019872 [Adiantum capillus-veneris]
MCQSLPAALNDNNAIKPLPTTVVIRKIPTSVRQQDLLKFLDSFCAENNLMQGGGQCLLAAKFHSMQNRPVRVQSSDVEIDYVHIPLSKKGAHKGFVVINFTKLKAALMFNALLHERQVEIGPQKFGSTLATLQKPMLFNPPCNGGKYKLIDYLQRCHHQISPGDINVEHEEIVEEDVLHLNLPPSRSATALPEELGTIEHGQRNSTKRGKGENLPMVSSASSVEWSTTTKLTATPMNGGKERKREKLKEKGQQQAAIYWPPNTMSVAMRGKLAAHLTSMTGVSPKKKSKKKKVKMLDAGGGIIESMPRPVLSNVVVSNSHLDDEAGVGMRQKIRNVYHGMLTFFFSGMSKLSVSRILSCTPILLC